MKKIDGNDLLEQDARKTSGHKEEFMRARCLWYIKKNGFPYKCVDTYEGREEIQLQQKTVMTLS